MGTIIVGNDVEILTMPSSSCQILPHTTICKLLLSHAFKSQQFSTQLQPSFDFLL